MPSSFPSPRDRNARVHAGLLSRSYERPANTYEMLARENLQQGNEVVPVPQVLEQISDMSAGLQQRFHGSDEYRTRVNVVVDLFF